MEKMVPANYYVQQSADYTLPHPGEGYRGWGKTSIPINPDKTVIAVMHAWENPKFEDIPGIYRVCEYLPRSERIMRELFPAFLEKVRKSGIRLIHIGSGSEKNLPDFPGYKRSLARTAPKPPQESIEADETLNKLRKLHQDLTLYDEENLADVIKSQKTRKIGILPRDDEDVVATSDQLFDLLKEYGANHIIYTGFCVNACLPMSPCGYLDMTRRGVMCSVIRELTTAVENRESCATEGNLAYGLWAYALWGGFVFEQSDVEQFLL